MKWIKVNTIFWKIFLSYWLVMLLIVMATTVAVALLLDQDHLKLRRQITGAAEATTAAYLYESGGPKAFEQWLREKRHRTASNTFLINETFQDVLGRPLPPKLIDDLAAGDEPDGPDKGHRWSIQKTASSSGQGFWFVGPAFKEERVIRRFWPMMMPRPFRGLMFILSLIVTGLISYGLARNITTPIRKLQSASRQISDGQFATRVDQKVSQRQDELGELGRDFDHMADKIELLLSSQQRILRDISHELRSPLARLQIALALARKATGEQAGAEHDRIQKEADRLDELIGQVISLVRLEAGAEKIEKQVIDFIPLFEQVVSDADFEAKAQHKSVYFTGVPKASVFANESLLSSAFENIVRNAVRYTEPQTTVEVAMRTTVSGGEQQVIISIKDQGPGVSEQALAHLFEPFYREADARDRNSGGYGLGLAIAERAIKAHDGKITARNRKGGGLEVTVILPLVV